MWDYYNVGKEEKPLPSADEIKEMKDRQELKELMARDKNKSRPKRRPMPKTMQGRREDTDAEREKFRKLFLKE